MTGWLIAIIAVLAVVVVLFCVVGFKVLKSLIKDFMSPWIGNN